MGSQFWWIFDAMVILIIGYIIYSNAKRGLTKVFVLNIGYIVAVTLSALVAVGAAPLVYESSVDATNVAAFEKANDEANFPKLFAGAIDGERYGFTADQKKLLSYLQESDNSAFISKTYDYCNRRYGGTVTGAAKFDTILRNAFIAGYSKVLDEHLPGYVSKNFRKQIKDDPHVMEEILDIYYHSSSHAKAAELLENKFAETPTLELLRMFTYVCIFAVIMIIVALIAALVKNTLFFNVNKASERMYGALLGLAELFSMLLLFTILTRVIVLLGCGEVLCFNDETIAATKIFRILYDNLGFLI